MVRLFFAVDLSDEVKGRIRDGIERIALERPPWRWVKVDNLHLTLKFLGEMPDDCIDALGACAAAVCADVPAFRIELGALGGFPNLARPRVLFFRMEAGADAMRDLADSLDSSLAQRLSIPREKRPFRAHATIARVKTPPPRHVIERLKSAPALQGAAQDVGNIALVRSELRREGAKYHTVKEFALSKSKC